MTALLLLLLGCGPSAVTLGGGGPGPDDSGGLDSPDVPVPVLALDGPPALDPLLGGPATFTVDHAEGDAVRVEVRDAAGAVVRTLADGTGLVGAVSWDGRDEAGALVPVGPYTVSAALSAAGVELLTAEAEVTRVRVGVTEGTLGGARIPLIWHYAGGRGQYWSGGTTDATFRLAALDDGVTATPIPTPWADTFTPPEDPVGQNLPAAYAWNAVPTLTLAVGGEAPGVDLSLAIPGWTTDDAAAAPGGTVTFTRDAPLADSVGVIEETLSLEWRADGEIVGTQAIPLRIYALLGPATFDSTEVPYQPWVAVIDPLLRAIGGTPPEAEAVTGAIVAYVYRDLELAYDTRSGASAYTWYQSWSSYDDAVFDLTAFLERRNGSIVNCSDCASIMDAHANMVGASLSYAIILQNFDLNYIKAIGGDDFTHCPFGGRGCGFSYHAVTTPDDAATIFDATLALDGDDDPSSSPSTELLVQSIPGEEYLDRLVMDGSASYHYVQKASIR